MELLSILCEFLQRGAGMLGVVLWCLALLLPPSLAQPEVCGARGVIHPPLHNENSLGKIHLVKMSM